MSNSRTITYQVRHVLRNITPTALNERSTRRKIIRQFAEEAGLLYFGSVSRRDDYQPIRGYTMSTTYRDNHYCLGNIRGYNIALVDRFDRIRRVKSPKLIDQRWLIVAVDMYTRRDVPYMFISSHEHSATYPSYKQQPIQLGTFGPYPPEFEQRYIVYGEPGRSVEIERYLTPDIAKVITSHFKGLSIEVVGRVVYVYANSVMPSMALLDQMASDALWLAAVLDVFAEQLAVARAKN